MEYKEFKTIDEQLNILKSRNLKVENETTAKEFLLFNNYYRISGYSLTLRKKDVFFKNATFQNIIDIYNFDHEFKMIIFRYLQIIEVNFKSVFAYEFSKVYGATGYLYSENFTNKKKHNEIMEKAEKQIEISSKTEAYLKHYTVDLKVLIPFWAFVDVLTIADISKLYSILYDDTKVAIAKHYDITVSNAAGILENAMHRMTIIRNLCAHGSRIFNRLFEQKPYLSKKQKAFLIKDENGAIDNARFYGFVLIMKQLLRQEDFCEFKSKIIKLCGKYPFVKMSYYGFRDDWKEIL